MVRRLDTIAVALGSAVILISGVLSGLSLREWSSLLGVVCVLGLIWRGISTLGEMSNLTRALTTCLALVLASGAFAQWLLMQELKNLPPGPPPPENVVGNIAVVISRILVLALVVVWPYFINRWGHGKHQQTFNPPRRTR